MKALTLSLLLVVATFMSAPAQATNPHFRLLIVKENALKKTQIGQAYAADYEKVNGNELILFSGNMKKEYRLKNKKLLININFMASDFEYLGWVLFQGLVRHSLRNSRMNELQKDILVWKESMKYLDQREMQVNNEMDYAYWELGEIARERLLNVSDFYELWQDNQADFLRAVTKRYRKLQ